MKHPLLIATLVAAASCAPQADKQKPSEKAEAEAERGFDPYCLTRPKLGFCDDFDTAPLPSAFSEARGNLSIEASEDSASLPSSLLAVTTGSTEALLTKSFGSGDKFRAFIQMYMDGITATAGDVEILRIDMASPGALNHRVGLGLRSDGVWYSYEQIGDATTAPGYKLYEQRPPIELGGWMSVKFDVHYDDALSAHQPILKVRFGGDEIGDKFILSPQAASATASITLGLRATGAQASDEWRARFDNFSFDVE